MKQKLLHYLLLCACLLYGADSIAQAKHKRYDLFVSNAKGVAGASGKNWFNTVPTLKEAFEKVIRDKKSGDYIGDVTQNDTVNIYVAEGHYKLDFKVGIKEGSVVNIIGGFPTPGYSTPPLDTCGTAYKRFVTYLDDQIGGVNVNFTLWDSKVQLRFKGIFFEKLYGGGASEGALVTMKRSTGGEAKNQRFTMEQCLVRNYSSGTLGVIYLCDQTDPNLVFDRMEILQSDNMLAGGGGFCQTSSTQRCHGVQLDVRHCTFRDVKLGGQHLGSLFGILSKDDYAYWQSNEMAEPGEGKGRMSYAHFENVQVWQVGRVASGGVSQVPGVMYLMGLMDVSFKNCLIRNAKGGKAGAIVVCNTANFLSQNNVYEGCTGESDGGVFNFLEGDTQLALATGASSMASDAWYVNGSWSNETWHKKIVFRNDKFYNNNSLSTGGAVQVSDQYDLSPGIVKRLTDVLFEKCSFSNNHARRGSAGAVQLANKGTKTFIDCDFCDNEGMKKASTETRGEGGAVRVMEDGYATFRNCVFRNNSTNRGGGAVMVETARGGEFIACTFKDNHSDEAANITNKGGGAILFDRGECVVDSCWFENNSAGSNGGAIGVRNEGDTHGFRKDGSKFPKIFIEGQYWVDTKHTLRVRNSKFIGNQAGFCGGAIGMTQGGTAGCVLYLANCLFEKNKNNGGDEYKGGGAIFLGSRNPMITSDSPDSVTVFRDNYSAASGGAICEGITVEGQQHISRLNHLHFYNNEAARSGGAVYFERSTTTGFGTMDEHFKNCHFEGNKAVWGGACSVNGYQAEAKWEQCHFLKNKAVATTDKGHDGGGGAVYLGDGVIGYYKDNVFERNFASFNGGAIYRAANAYTRKHTIELDGDIFKHNGAGTSPSVAEGDKMPNVTLATGTGGAIFFGSCGSSYTGFNWKSAKFEGNIAGGAGAVYFVSFGSMNIAGSTPRYITYCEFLNNKAINLPSTDGKGGGAIGIKNGYAVCDMSNSKFFGNTSNNGTTDAANSDIHFESKKAELYNLTNNEMQQGENVYNVQKTKSGNTICQSLAAPTITLDFIAAEDSIGGLKLLACKKIVIPEFRDLTQPQAEVYIAEGQGVEPSKQALWGEHLAVCYGNPFEVKMTSRTGDAPFKFRYSLYVNGHKKVADEVLETPKDKFKVVTEEGATSTDEDGTVTVGASFVDTVYQSYAILSHADIDAMLKKNRIDNMKEGDLITLVVTELSDNNSSVQFYDCYTAAEELTWFSQSVSSSVLLDDCVDTDGDGIPDNKDVDDDNDGIPDNNECPDGMQESTLPREVSNLFVKKLSQGTKAPQRFCDIVTSAGYISGETEAAAGVLTITPTVLSVNTYQSGSTNGVIDISDKFGYPAGSGAVTVKVKDFHVNSAEKFSTTMLGGHRQAFWAVGGTMHPYVLVQATPVVAQNQNTYIAINLPDEADAASQTLLYTTPNSDEYIIEETAGYKKLIFKNDVAQVDWTGKVGLSYLLKGDGTKFFSIEQSDPQAGEVVYYVTVMLPCDTDHDGIPDTKDDDADGDGCPDVREGENPSTKQHFVEADIKKVTGKNAYGDDILANDQLDSDVDKSFTATEEQKIIWGPVKADGKKDTLRIDSITIYDYPATYGFPVASTLQQTKGSSQDAESSWCQNFWVGDADTDFYKKENWTSHVPQQGEDIVFATADNNPGGKTAKNDLRLPVEMTEADGTKKPFDYVINDLTNQTPDNKALIVPANAALTVTGAVTGMESKAQASRLKLEAADQADLSKRKADASFMLNNENACETKVYAQVAMYSPAGKLSNPTTWIDDYQDSPNAGAPNKVTHTWQYFGLPVKKVAWKAAHYPYSDVRLYDETLNSPYAFFQKWTRLEDRQGMEAFKGYRITQDQPTTYHVTGQLDFCDHTFVMTRKASMVKNKQTNADIRRYAIGQNLFANSYSAALKVDALIFDKNADDVDKTVYLYTTGSLGDWAAGAGTNLAPNFSQDDNAAAGTYVSLPVKTARTIGVPEIPSKQGFLLRFLPGKEGDGTLENATVNVNYRMNTDELSVKHGERPMRSRERQEAMGVVKMAVSGEAGADLFFMIETEKASDSFDNGYDGCKLNVEGVTKPQLFFASEDGAMQVNATNEILNRAINFTTPKDGNYTLALKKEALSQYENLKLVDLVAEKIVAIDNETVNYEFVATTNDQAARFYFVNSDSDDFTYITGISTVKADSTKASGTYDLQGRHSKTDHKQIYVIDGKKTLIK